MRYRSADIILNRAAAEIGLPASQDFIRTGGETSLQMLALLNSAGQELLELNEWPQFRNVYEITTAAGDTGEYQLPPDFSHMINQTGWDRTNRVAMGGPLSAQDWTYLEGRDLVSQTIYASFRLADSRFYLFPQPPPVDLKVTFEYQSNYWVLDPDIPQTNPSATPNKDFVTKGSDVVVYDSLLITKFLKLKYLNAKGLPSAEAAMEFDTILQSRIGRATGAPVLSAGNNSRGYPYLSPYRNTGDSGYGGV